MSVNTELQALLTKMGGTPLESDSNSDLIKKISNAYEGSGTGGSVLVVMADENGVLDKTWKEIYDASFAVITNIDVEDGAKFTVLIEGVYLELSTYKVRAGNRTFYTDSEDGYPGPNNSGDDDLQPN